MSVVKRYAPCERWLGSFPMEATMCETNDGKYILASDYDAEHQRRVEAEEALADCASLLDGIEPEVRGGYSPDGALTKARAHLARYKE